MTVRVLLVDDHRLMREGLRSILEQDGEFEVVGEAASGKESLEQVEVLRPEVVIMDVRMHDMNGIDATREIHSRWPETRVVALSSHPDRRYVRAVLNAGAAAYVLKAGAYEDLSRAVRAVSEGKRYLCAEIAGIVVDDCFTDVDQSADGAADGDGERSPFRVLAPRERQVLRMIAEGLTSSRIGEQLHVSTHTVETHRRNLMRKLGLHNVADLTRYAIRQGLVSEDS